MILNVSGRCDVPAFFSKWFMNRLKEGYVDVRNPFYPKQVSRIYLKDVDLIVFISKNPLPMIEHLKEIKIPILFHITLTPYHKDIEENVIDKTKIIEGIKEISKIIGKENTYVRYDPIIINDKYNIGYHIKAFDRICNLLDGYIEHIIISFVDNYKNVQKNMKVLKIKELTEDDYKIIGENFYRSAKNHHMTVQTCSEENTLVEYGFLKRDCIDRNLAFRLTGKARFKKWSGRNNKYCNCVEMVDIGCYNMCNHLCKYCYANYDEGKIKENMKNHNPNSSLLMGSLKNDDIIKVRK